MKLRIMLTFAAFICVAGPAAYAVTMWIGGDGLKANGEPAKRFAKAAIASYSDASDTFASAFATESPLIEEARVPFPPRNVTPPGVYTGPVRRHESPAASESTETEPPIARRTFRRVVVEEAGLLSSGNARVRLADVTTPELDATCTDASGEDWPCGRRAMAALRLLVRNRSVDCRIAEESADELIGRCRVGDRDIAVWLVEQGWAEPDGGRYQEAFEAAQSEERGMFAGSQNAAPQVSIPVSNAPAD